MMNIKKIVGKKIWYADRTNLRVELEKVLIRRVTIEYFFGVKANTETILIWPAGWNCGANPKCFFKYRWQAQLALWASKYNWYRKVWNVCH